MFRLTYRDKYDKDHSRTEYFDDIKDIGQALINLVDNEKEEQYAMEWCGRANFGDKVVRQQFGYKLECFSETELKNKVEQVINELCNKINTKYNAKVAYSFVGWDNDALTWDLNIFTSWIKYRDDYGYYIVINDDNYPNGLTELFSCTDKNANRFLDRAQKGIEEVLINKGVINNTKGNFCRFIVGQTYMGSNKASQNISIIITKKTPQYVYYKTDTGIVGKAMIKHMGGHEAILIKKVNNLIVVSTDKWN